METDEFVESLDWCIVTGKDAYENLTRFPVQHIARKSDNRPLCGVRICFIHIWDLYDEGYLCERCKQKYMEALGDG